MKYKATEAAELTYVKNQLPHDSVQYAHYRHPENARLWNVSWLQVGQKGRTMYHSMKGMLLI
jgi:hypothetical protein